MAAGILGVCEVAAVATAGEAGGEAPCGKGNAPDDEDATREGATDVEEEEALCGGAGLAACEELGWGKLPTATRGGVHDFEDDGGMTA